MTKCDFQQLLKTKTDVFIKNASKGATKLSGKLNYPIINWREQPKPYPRQCIILYPNNDDASIVIQDGDLYYHTMFNGDVFIYKKFRSLPLHMSDIRYGSLHEIVEDIKKGGII